jgi:hypothetical protein
MFDAMTAWTAIGALLAGAALQVVLAIAGFRTRNTDKAQAEAHMALKRELRALQAECGVLTRRLLMLEAQGALKVPVTVNAPVARTPADPAYELAGKLARKGASMDELMDTCGLSRGEVELIATLNTTSHTDQGTQVKKPATTTA